MWPSKWPSSVTIPWTDELGESKNSNRRLGICTLYLFYTIKAIWSKYSTIQKLPSKNTSNASNEKLMRNTENVTPIPPYKLKYNNFSLKIL